MTVADDGADGLVMAVGGQTRQSTVADVMHHAEVETLTPCDATLSDPPSSSQVCLPKSMCILLAQINALH